MGRDCTCILKSGFVSKPKGRFFIMPTIEKENIVYINELMKYDKLKHLIIDTFRIYMTYFKEGNFATLEEKFITTEAIRLGQILVDGTLSNTLSKSKFTNKNVSDFKASGTKFSSFNTTSEIFPNYTSFIHLLIDGLNSAILLNKSNNVAKNRVNELQIYKDTLFDAKLLQKYIEDNYNNFNSSLIDVDMPITTQLAVKIEYEIYIKRHGIPSNGIFDSVLLNNIIYEIRQ